MKEEKESNRYAVIVNCDGEAIHSINVTNQLSSYAIDCGDPYKYKSKIEAVELVDFRKYKKLKSRIKELEEALEHYAAFDDEETMWDWRGVSVARKALKERL